MSNYLDKLKPFFKENVDFSKIKKPYDILELPIINLKVIDEQWMEFLDDLEIKTIKDLGTYKEQISIEGLDPDDTNKAAMIAEMIFWQITQIAEKGEQKKKIMLLGLDNAGKTSTLTALSEKYSGFKQLLPTRGLQRQSISIFGYEIMSFDMGGQADYRDQYFQKADMYFSTADLVLYCIDAQDKARYDESMEYLTKIVGAFESFKLYPPILVIFTKMDPDILNDEKINEDRMGIIEKIEKICAKHDVAYTNSTIFDRNTIENLFSMALKRVSTSNAVIDELLRQFAKEIGARATCLISSSGLVFGSYGESKQDEEMLSNSAAYLQNLYLFHVNQGIQKEDFYQMEYKRNNLHFIAEFITEIESGMTYLWVLTQDLRAEVQAVGKFKEELIPLVKIFL